MAGTLLLGIDSGLTLTKAVLFSLDGRAVGLGRAEAPQLYPSPGHVERDMTALWQATAKAIRLAIETSGARPSEIAGIGVTAHGDGLFPLAGDGAPLGNAILSLDSRAVDVVDQWRDWRVLDRSLELTGQHPHAAAPSSILAWLKLHEPERYGKLRWALYCKDWLRYCLTGAIATDPTEASVSFTNVQTQDYDPSVLDLFGLDELASAMPPIQGVMEVAGAVTDEAAAATGLVAGTAVVTGLHDVTATAIGMGGIHAGQLSLVAGTYSINEVISTAPTLDARWFCRNGFRPGEWNNMAISPASSANSEWFLRQFCRDAIHAAEQNGGSPFDYLQPEIEAAFARDNHMVYHPYLFGSPHGGEASASLLGLQGWHERGDVLRAVFEGIVFNHKEHVDALRSAFTVSEAGLAGGGARNPLFSQLFADALGIAITVVDQDEVGALGVALAAGVGVGCYPSLESASEATKRVLRRHTPDEGRHRELDAAFRRYLDALERVTPLWPAYRH